MASVGIDPLFCVSPFGASGVLTQVVDATNDSAGAVLQAHKDGSITHIGRWVSTVTGTGTTGRVQMETLTGSPALPSGTLWDTNTFGTDNISATGWSWVELDTAGDVTEGQEFAVTYLASAADGSNNATFSYGLANVGNSATCPYSCNRVAGTWGIQTAAPIFAARYGASGDIIYGSAPITGFASGAAIALDTTPDEVGVKWTAPVSGTCYGLEIIASLSNLNFTGVARLYANNVEVANRTLTGTRFRSTGVGRVLVRWATPATITAGVAYRAVIYGTTNSATGNIRLINLTHESADSLQKTLSTLAFRCSRTDAGSWTDSATANIMSIIPLMESETAGGGLLVHPGMTGGIRG